ncbi:carboxylate--amine ligase [Serinibacter arcticus]|uniref:Carboxylate--amine ligase n=1 Tax=Serinibacter arcticus TaxID=1655435 RepID=A0A2U1ZS93_9MICO|nr:carboxylate--amine ligase [Serinibacter arcticus]PWD49792.1 carboxylate--amine ligase [Serinibacter arcticus]
MPPSAHPTLASAPGGSPRPIVLGGDIGAYGTARAFHEAFGVTSVVLAGAATWPVRDSSIVDLRVVGEELTVEAVVRRVRAVVAEEPGRTHVLLASADWLVDVVVAARAALAADGVVVPYAAAEVVAAASHKGTVMRACERLGLPHPRTLVVAAGSEVPAEVPLPAVVKFASTADAHDVDYAGRAKVHRVTDRAELVALLGRIGATGYTGDVLVQEELPGGDAAMAAVNVMVDAAGRVTFAQLGRVLLEEHTPTALGNSVAQVTADASSDAAARASIDDVLELLRDLDWRGFANVDLMRGADGRYRVLEINPRVGRSGFAPTASGYNVARLYVEGWIGAAGAVAPAGGDGGASGDDGAASAPAVLGEREHLFVVVPLAILRRYAPDARAQVRALRRAGAVTNPLYYRAERNPRRWLFIAVAMVNQVRKFRRFHPGA